MDAEVATKGWFGTRDGRKYLVQLCQHFAHKIPAEAEGDKGRITFPYGEARLSADDTGLGVVLDVADAEMAARMRKVIDDHLQRFAFREDFSGMEWR